MFKFYIPNDKSDDKWYSGITIIYLYVYGIRILLIEFFYYRMARVEL